MTYESFPPLTSPYGSQDGHCLLDEIVAFLGRFVAFASPAQADAVAVWVVHTHAAEQAECTPRLHVCSAEPRSGKSRLAEILALLVHRPLMTVTISEAALFRIIDHERPTLLMDEADAIWGPKAKDHEDLRALINAGHRKGAAAYRCVLGAKGEIRVKKYDAYAPAAIIGIGELPNTIADRAIRIRLKRRVPGKEPVARLRWRAIVPDANLLRGRIEEWVKAHESYLEGHWPDLPDQLDDRAADGWEPLFTIADFMGGDWPARARTAAVTLSEGRDAATTPSFGVQLLTDLRGVFADNEALTTTEILDRLNGIEDSPWSTWGRGKGLSANQLARLLKPYEIKPKVFRRGNDTPRGYHAQWFAEWWASLCPGNRAQQPQQSPLTCENTVAPTLSDDPDVAPQKPAPTCDVAGVAPNSGVQTEDPVTPSTESVLYADGWDDYCLFCSNEVTDVDPYTGAGYCAKHWEPPEERP